MEYPKALLGRVLSPSNGAPNGGPVTGGARTKETETQYKHRVQQLIRRYRKATGRGDVAGLIEWITQKHRAGEFSGSTWRQYRAALVAILGEMGVDTSSLRMAGRMLGDEAPKASAEEPATPPRNGGCPRPRARPVKAVGITGRRALQGACRHLAAATQEDIMTWMEAGIRTGLRPGEWAQATLDHPTPGGRAVLTVHNAKHTNGRGHGVLRRLALLTPETEEWVRRHLALLRERQIQGISFTTHYRNTRRALNRAYQRAGTRGPSLYSARHQFKTNARAAGVSAWNLAYLMGHASTITAQCHYGRGRAQTSAFTVAPAPAPGDPAPVIRVGELPERPHQRIGRNPKRPQSTPRGP